METAEACMSESLPATLAQLRTTFAGRRVLVTGHTGFKGGWLCLWLQRLGATVSGYALDAPTEPNLFALADVGNAMHSTIADVRDGERLAATIVDFRPEIVFHLAAQPLVRFSYDDPVATYATNVMGSVHLLEALRHVDSVRAAIIVSSDKCYDNPDGRPGNEGFRETDPMGGNDPYSSSKGCTELLVHSYRQSFFHPRRYAEHGLALASVRAGNVIGGGDWSRDRLIPDLIMAFRAGRPAIVRNPAAVRPWQHVLEPLYGYLLLADRLYRHGPAFGEAWNFGPDAGDSLPVAKIATALVAAWGGRAQWQLSDEADLTVAEAPHEAHILRLDCNKAKSRLDWRPVCPLSQGLLRVVDWYRAFDAGDDLRAFCQCQISAHEAAIIDHRTGSQ